MSKHNYTQYSNKNNRPKEEKHTPPVSDQYNVAVVEDTVVPAVDVTVEPVVPVAPAEIKMEPKMATGVIANCARLNVRVAPNADATVACVLNATTEVTIDVSKSTDEWFKVCTATGVEGYCMRKFVEAKL